MRGLTPDEFEVLSRAANPPASGPRQVSEARKQIWRDLLEQGRARVGPPHLPNTGAGWYITAAGREALRLWPAVKAALEGAR